MFEHGNDRPSAHDAAVRTYVLKFVIVSALVLPLKATFAELSSAWPKPEFETFIKKLTADRNAQRERLGRWRTRLSSSEHLFATASPEDVTVQQQTDATWRLEAFQVLLWALCLVESLPSYDTKASGELLKKFPPDGEIDPYLKQARLRPTAEINYQREMAELWHWRSRTRQLVEDGTPLNAKVGFESYDEIVRSVSAKAGEIGDIGEVTNEDFTAFGVAYRDLSEDQWSTVRSITMERHFALNWLCGYAPNNEWDDTPTDT